jgi:Holliday junction resolvase RusA-like endonuclease
VTASLILTVIGLPAPQGSKTRMPNGAMVEAASKSGRDNLRSWRDSVITACRECPERPDTPLDEPVRVVVDFLFPASKSKPYRHYHAQKPDLDKLVRATLDAVRLGGLIADDALVCNLAASKRWCSVGEVPGARIKVVPWGADEAYFAGARKEAAAELRKRPRADEFAAVATPTEAAG